jgi:hypothetical protein
MVFLWPTIATAVSRWQQRAAGLARTAPRKRLVSAVARASLCGLFAMSLEACLVTSSPTFEDPERTPPFLVAATAQPDLREILVVNKFEVSNPLVFSAGLRSEDNGESIVGLVVRNYGVEGSDTKPYEDELGRRVAEPGTLDDTSRRLSVPWYVNKADINGCANVSLLAMHKVDEITGCPVDPVDFDFLTWTVIVCEGSMDCCDPTAGPGEEDACSNLACPEIDPEIRCGVNLPTANFDSQGGAE